MTTSLYWVSVDLCLLHGIVKSSWKDFLQINHFLNFLRSKVGLRFNCQTGQIFEFSKRRLYIERLITRLPRDSAFSDDGWYILTHSSVQNSKRRNSQSGTNPVKILQRKFYSTKFFKHSDWILNIFNQSKCFKNCLS